LISARSDVQTIIKNEGITATLIRQTEIRGNMGETNVITEENYSIYLVMNDILRNDRQIHNMGLSIPGESKAILFHEYPDSITGNGIISVEVGDIIQDDEVKKWRVEQILRELNMNGGEIFRTAILKRIDLDQ